MTAVLVAVVAAIPILVTGILTWLQTRDPYMQVRRAAEVRKALPRELQTKWDVHLGELVAAHTDHSTEIKIRALTRRATNVMMVGLCVVYFYILGVALWLWPRVADGADGAWPPSYMQDLGWAALPAAVLIVIWLLWVRSLRHKISDLRGPRPRP